MTSSALPPVHGHVSAEIMSREAELPAPARAATTTEEAFRRLAAGSFAALEELYDLEVHGLFALALWITGSREDAADAVQDVFVKLTTRREGLGEVRRPRAYLFAMARSAALDRLRADRGDEPADDLLLEAPADDPAGNVDGEAASRHLRSLPRLQREAVYLRYFAELSFAEIGRVTGVSLFTAASRCRLGLRKLRRRMGVDP